MNQNIIIAIVAGVVVLGVILWLVLRKKGGGASVGVLGKQPKFEEGELRNLKTHTRVYLVANEEMSIQDAVRVLNVSQEDAEYLLEKFTKEGLLVSKGSEAAPVYMLKKQDANESEKE